MPHMEEQLGLTLGQLLPIMQERVLNGTTYFGIRTLKSPIDFWVYQEIIFETKPDVIIEVGNFHGGSALALAHICDSLGAGRIIGLDLSHDEVTELVRQHPRITLIEGDACQSFESVKALINDTESVMVIEDSSHTFENTLAVLDTYSQLVKPGGYFIVEDGICNHGLEVDTAFRAYEAIDAFIERNPHFEIDRSRESFLITWNPKGYLKRAQ
ncbi:MAG TPA: CmcI family methyltransferase [Pyrinomonadaceae bacterium]